MSQEPRGGGWRMLMALVVAGAMLWTSDPAASQPFEPASAPQEGQESADRPPVGPGGITPPDDYVIGADDVLGILFWREESLSGDVVVRPDGKITVPLLNEIQAAGLTTSELRRRITEEAARYLDTPNVTVVVRQINSRKVYITGEITAPGTYPLSASMTVMQLLALAGGLRDYADSDDIVIMRFEDGVEKLYKFNYRHVLEGKNVRQNIRLEPGDTIVVP